MNKKLIRLTESDLHRIVRDSIANVLNEVSHGYVQARVDAARKRAQQNGGNREAQINRMTDTFNDINGSENIRYDFRQNKKLEPGTARLHQYDLPGSYLPRYNINRPYDEQNKSGGVTINGQRYVPGSKREQSIYNVEPPSIYSKTGDEVNNVSDDAWAWYGAMNGRGSAVFDKNGQRVDTNQFSPEEISALNNVNDTMEYTDFMGRPMTLRGGRPFKPQQ